MSKLRIAGASGLCFLLLSGCGSNATPQSGANATPERQRPDLVRRQTGVGDIVLHSFSTTGGYNPVGPVAMDSGGNVYGATAFASNGDGTVFKWSSPSSFSTIFTFPSNGSKGKWPVGGVIIDSSGTLYGIANSSDDYEWAPGLVFKLTPSGSTYTYSNLHSFTGSYDGDGANPTAPLIIDSSGNIYGTTAYGGATGTDCGTESGPIGCGTVFELSPSGSGYSYSVLYRFGGGTDGSLSAGGLLSDSSGNLYGTTMFGGSGCDDCGTVYKLSNAGGVSWTKTTLHNFAGGSDGKSPSSALIADSGNLFGTTQAGGAHSCGTIFKLHPTGGGAYSESVLHSFSCGAGAISGLTLALGLLWGAHETSSGSCCGAIFDSLPSGGGIAEYNPFEGYANDDGAGPVAPTWSGYLWYPTGSPIEQSYTSIGSLYGVTLSGGAHTGCSGGSGSGYWAGCGTLYSLEIGSGGAKKRAKPLLRKAASQ